MKRIRRTSPATQKRYAAEEKIRILMEGLRGEEPISAICRREGIHSNPYYRWLKDFMEAGETRPKGEETRGVTRGSPGRAWNWLRGDEVAKGAEYAHLHPHMASRELACKLPDEVGFTVSESTAYRILRSPGLIGVAPVLLAAAASEFPRQTIRVHELWQTDLT